MTRLINLAKLTELSHCLLKRIAKAMVLLLPLIFYQSVSGQEDSRPFQLIRARLINNRTGGPVVFAKVINKDLRSAVLSDSLGVFSMSARIKDTLYIKSISYYPTTIAVSDSLIWQIRIPEIPLIEQAYELGGIDIYGWGSYQEFKYKFLHSPSPDDKTKKMQDDLKRALGIQPQYPLQEQSGISLGSPITGLYMMFSKEGKSLRRLAAAKDRDKVFLLTYQKFNREIAGIVTGLTGNLLDQFMLFCRPGDAFLLQANDYDIHLRILEDYNQFKKAILDKPKNKAPL